MKISKKIIYALALAPIVAHAHQPINRSAQTPIFLASIPKCGSHLIKKCLSMIHHDHFRYPSRTFFNAAARDFQRKGSIFSHAPFNPELGQLITDNEYKGIFMIRDPRDQAVSFIHFAQKSNKIWSTIRSMSFDNALTNWILDAKLIKGTGRFNDPMMDTLGSIADFYDHYLPWIDHPNFYTVRFENLVGAQGGGSDELQKQEILNIAAHLDIKLDDQTMQKTLDHLFGKSRTFRKGQIGNWKEVFTEEQKQIFKDVAGDLLIHLGYEQDYNW